MKSIRQLAILCIIVLNAITLQAQSNGSMLADSTQYVTDDIQNTSRGIVTSARRQPPFEDSHRRPPVEEGKRPPFDISFNHEKGHNRVMIISIDTRKAISAIAISVCLFIVLRFIVVYISRIVGGGIFGPVMPANSAGDNISKHLSDENIFGTSVATTDDEFVDIIPSQNIISATTAQQDDINADTTPLAKSIDDEILLSFSENDKELVLRLNKYIEGQINNIDLSVNDLAASVCMSRSNLFRRIKSLYGLTPNEYLRHKRLKYAAKLISERKYNISDICLIVGFNSPSYFSSCFKKQYGVLPRDY